MDAQDRQDGGMDRNRVSQSPNPILLILTMGVRLFAKSFFVKKH